MSTPQEIKMIRDSNNFTLKEISICCCLSNRQNKQDLFQAAYVLNLYKMNSDTKFIKDSERSLIRNLNREINL